MTIFRKLQPYLVFISFFLIFLPSCCKEECQDTTNPECANYDPCHARSNAAFVILDSLRYTQDDIGYAFETDTFQRGKTIRFRALHENAAYEWKIGSDPELRTKKEFTLFFDEFATGNIPVRLITTNPANPDCLGDDGRDTFYRTIYIFTETGADLLAIFPVFNTFTGYDTDKPDVTYDVIIEPDDPSVPFGFWHLTGLNNCYDTNYDFLASYRGFVWEGYTSNCENPRGYATIEDDLKTVIIHYNVGHVNGPRTEKTFIGVKN